jgi:hypothetical protein
MKVASVTAIAEMLSQVTSQPLDQSEGPGDRKDQRRTPRTFIGLFDALG